MHNTTVNGREIAALRDTGASVSVVHPAVVQDHQYLSEPSQRIRSTAGAKDLRMAEVTLCWEGVEHPLRVAVAPELAVAMLLGNDSPGEVAAAVKARAGAREA
ncbi:retroviral-like aspartic protease family protein, partial [Bacillus cereus group sp. Bce037]|uniref:retroviral-like aspartic protease family protein n=1 Tax=Bacillus cereus group sp. Bce037 TaxID=3445232 RepID=UPI003F1EC71D